MRLNRLYDLLWLTQQKALLKILIKPFFRKCILNKDAAFMDFAVKLNVQEEQCKKISGKLLNLAYISQLLKQISKIGSERYQINFLRFFETFRYHNSVSQNFDPSERCCLTFISKKFKKETFCVEV